MKLTEIFHSIQGEGINIGLPTIFIRFSGCNLDCTWCDTDYAKHEGEEYTLDRVLERLGKYPGCRNVCVTGGEPLCQLDEARALMEKLLALDYGIVLETNGSVDLAPIAGLLGDTRMIIAMDVKTPSSGEQDSFLSSNLKFLNKKDMIKFVIADENDYEFSKKFLEHLRPNCNIVFTSEGGTNLRWLSEKVIQDDLNVRVLPQLHKLIWGSNARSV